MKLFSKLGTTALALVLGASLPALAQDLPPEAAALMEPLPLSPTGQVVPGYPDGAPASTADIFTFTDEDVAKLKEGKFTAGLVMHTMDAGWPALQVAGITKTLNEFGIEVVATTDAKFQPGQQISDLEQMIARAPDVIFSIPIDPQSQSSAYKKAAAAGIKLVFMDNVPVDMTPGTDYVTVVASDNEKNAYFAAQELVAAIGGEGQVGVITLVYDYYYSVAARKAGALKAFAEHGCWSGRKPNWRIRTCPSPTPPGAKGGRSPTLSFCSSPWDRPARRAPCPVRRWRSGRPPCGPRGSRPRASPKSRHN